MAPFLKVLEFKIGGHKTTLKSIFESSITSPRATTDKTFRVEWQKVLDLLEICRIEVSSFPGDGTVLRRGLVCTEFKTPADKVLDTTARKISDFLQQLGATPASISAYLRMVW